MLWPPDGQWRYCRWVVIGHLQWKKYIFKFLMFNFSKFEIAFKYLWNNTDMKPAIGNIITREIIYLLFLIYLTFLYIVCSSLFPIDMWTITLQWTLTCTQRWTLMSVGGIAGNTTGGWQIFDWGSDFDKTLAYIVCLNDWIRVAIRSFPFQIGLRLS